MTPNYLNCGKQLWSDLQEMYPGRVTDHVIAMILDGHCNGCIWQTLNFEQPPSAQLQTAFYLAMDYLRVENHMVITKEGC